MTEWAIKDLIESDYFPRLFKNQRIGAIEKLMLLLATFQGEIKPPKDSWYFLHFDTFSKNDTIFDCLLDFLFNLLSVQEISVLLQIVLDECSLPVGVNINC